MSEKQTCPRRMEIGGSRGREKDLDLWITDRWKKKEDRWNLDWIPRTCNWCGGIHPEDSIRLVKEYGFEVEKTDKNYKIYLEPPGYRIAFNARINNLRKFKNGEIKEEDIEGRTPSVWSPTPPAKVYLQHFSQDDVDAINAVLKDRENEKR